MNYQKNVCSINIDSNDEFIGLRVIWIDKLSKFVIDDLIAIIYNFEGILSLLNMEDKYKNVLEFIIIKSMIRQFKILKEQYIILTW